MSLDVSKDSFNHKNNGSSILLVNKYLVHWYVTFQLTALGMIVLKSY